MPSVVGNWRWDGVGGEMEGRRDGRVAVFALTASGLSPAVAGVVVAIVSWDIDSSESDTAGVFDRTADVMVIRKKANSPDPFLPLK